MSAAIGLASFLADVGHEVPTALLPRFVTQTLGAPAAALGLVEGVSEGLAGAGRFVVGCLSPSCCSASLGPIGRVERTALPLFVVAERVP